MHNGLEMFRPPVGALSLHCHAPFALGEQHRSAAPPPPHGVRLVRVLARLIPIHSLLRV